MCNDYPVPAVSFSVTLKNRLSGKIREKVYVKDVKSLVSKDKLPIFF